MKKLIFILIPFLLATGAFAQYFAPVGAKWTYTHSTLGSSGPPFTVRPLTIEVIKDTLIIGLACRELEIKLDTATRYKYIRSTNDSVLFYSSLNNKFNLLYDFTANIGDTLPIYYTGADFYDVFPELDSTWVIVDSIGTKNIFGINYRAYHQTCSTNCPERSIGWVIDSLGINEYSDWISYLFPAMNIAGGQVWDLRCYTDSNTNYFYSDCDTTYTITGIKLLDEKQMEIFPTILNHDNKKITIKTINSANLQQIKLFSITGFSIPLEIKKQGNLTQLRINQKISAGIYLLSFQLENEMITHKIIVL